MHITIFDDHYQKIKNLEYIPVGLGENITLNNFVTDKTGINISKKNPYYGEYTFHYWLWKNNNIEKKNDWIGFCQYRKFWLKMKSLMLQSVKIILKKIYLKKFQ